MKSYSKPILKWIGGKTQIIDKIINNFPNEINNYHEIFLGGGSVLIALLENIKKNNIKVYGNIYAYDINEILINLYINIQNNVDIIINNILKIIEEYNNIKTNIINKKPLNLEDAYTSKESYYYWIRNKYNQLTIEEKKSSLGTSYFIFLNKTCFRGMYREGPNGFNVPYGHYKNPEIINRDHLIYISNLIKDVKFYSCNFEESFSNILFDNFVYLDPPYAPENNKSFVEYTSNGFDYEQHCKLFTICKRYKFLMSNSDVSFVKENFNDNIYSIEIISCKSSINAKKPNSKTNEVMIKSY